VVGAETAAAVEREIRIAASPETVFQFFIDPDRQIQWMGRSADLDPRAGGTYRVDLNGRDIARGEYIELDPPNRVVFTWGWESQGSPVRPGASTVEITLSADGDGTIVRLVHRDLPEDSRAPHGHGWEHYLNRLAIAAEGGDAGEDPWGTPEGADAGD
jgi:uncharacterized protein YndB with AHSA1/START domain